MAATSSTKAPAKRAPAKSSSSSSSTARKRTPAKAAPTPRRPRKVLPMAAQIDAAVERWAREGRLERTGWRGAPLLLSPLPDGPDVELDLERVERVLDFFLLLRQLIGRHAGRRFLLLDWQVRYLVAPTFGIVDKVTRRRVIRTVWFEIPRKNGKSTLCSGLALYLFAADREPGAQVYTAAGDRGQAGIVFGPCRDMAAGSPELARKLGKGIRRHYLEHPRTGSILRALSSDGARQHGLNVHGAIIDEVHVHKSPDLVDALETGVGSREQPLVVFITTADEGTDGSIYATKREYLEGIVAGTIVDRSFYGVVFGADHLADGFDPFADDTLVAANPGADVTVLMEYLRGKAAEARQSPSQLNRYLRLHLNVRTKQSVRWLPLDRWDAAAGELELDTAFRGRPTYLGLDLSSTTDFTAAAFLTPLVDADGGQAEGYAVHVLHWIPEERAEELERRTGVPLLRWREEGWLRFTEGNVVDYAQVRADIRAELELLGATLAEGAYDPWNATETVLEMQNADGYTMVPIRQGYASLSAPAKELERLVMGSTPDAPLLVHGANPVLRWMADNVEVQQDPAGNIKPAKPDRRKSAKRIDGIAAIVNALARAMLRPPPKKPKRAVGF
jgi:phage terminase large subunit-like protein